MIENARQNRVCSVLFVDVVGYSRHTVAEQMELRGACNEALAGALGAVPDFDRVIVDTGDGAAVAFLGAPENALFAGLRIREATPVSLRMGINLGPVRVVTDANGQRNVIGDGINVAQRVMSFCEPGELLVSRSFYEVASRLATDYVDLFVPRGERRDKNARSHQVYGLVPDARFRLRQAEAEWLQRTPPARRTKSPVGMRPVSDEPARIFDAGSHLIISGPSREGVEAALGTLGSVRVISPPNQVGDKWMLTCEHPQMSDCKVEALGYTRIITGPTRDAVQIKVEELVSAGAVLRGEIEHAGGRWMAVCEMGI